MARRRKPINFELITAGDTGELTRALDDLRLKRPCGPNQDLHAEDYEEHPWSLPRLVNERYGDRSDGAGGYTDLQIFQIAKACGLEGDSFCGWSLKWKLDNLGIWSEIGQAGMTRRINRLNERMSQPYRRAVREGKVGESVFKVRMQRDAEDYHLRERNDVYVNASGAAEAEMIANTLFGYALGHAAHCEFQSTGGLGDCVAGNEETRNQLAKRVAQAQREIAQLQQKIESWEASREAIGMFTLSRMTESEDN
mgnify:CR=1 FL=1